MVIIIGLGNPGEKYKNTRHNVGFMAIDAFAKINNFPEFKLNKKSNSLISEKPFDSAQCEDTILLAKPQTFMNNSGKSVKSLIKNLKLKIKNYIVVVHDDVDLSIGKIKIVKERGSAGHKGVESIIKNIGNDGLIRFRIGIKPQDTRYKIQNTKTLVLKNFSKEEQKTIDETIQKTTDALDLFIKEGLEKTMNEYNK
jgi:peptidyl-tRNA hydrolase, PTH1 family